MSNTSMLRRGACIGCHLNCGGFAPSGRLIKCLCGHEAKKHLPKSRNGFQGQELKGPCQSTGCVGFGSPEEIWSIQTRCEACAGTWIAHDYAPVPAEGLANRIDSRTSLPSRSDDQLMDEDAIMDPELEFRDVARPRSPINAAPTFQAHMSTEMAYVSAVQQRLKKHKTSSTEVSAGGTWTRPTKSKVKAPKRTHSEPNAVRVQVMFLPIQVTATSISPRNPDLAKFKIPAISFLDFFKRVSNWNLLVECTVPENIPTPELWKKINDAFEEKANLSGFRLEGSVSTVTGVADSSWVLLKVHSNKSHLKPPTGHPISSSDHILHPKNFDIQNLQKISPQLDQILKERLSAPPDLLLAAGFKHGSICGKFPRDYSPFSPSSRYSGAHLPRCFEKHFFNGLRGDSDSPQALGPCQCDREYPAISRRSDAMFIAPDSDDDDILAPKTSRPASSYSARSTSNSSVSTPPSTEPKKRKREQSKKENKKRTLNTLSEHEESLSSPPSDGDSDRERTGPRGIALSAPLKLPHDFPQLPTRFSSAHIPRPAQARSARQVPASVTAVELPYPLLTSRPQASVLFVQGPSNFSGVSERIGYTDSRHTLSSVGNRHVPTLPYPAPPMQHLYGQLVQERHGSLSYYVAPITAPTMPTAQISSSRPTVVPPNPSLPRHHSESGPSMSAAPLNVFSATAGTAANLSPPLAPRSMIAPILSGEENHAPVLPRGSLASTRASLEPSSPRPVTSSYPSRLVHDQFNHLFGTNHPSSSPFIPREEHRRSPLMPSPRSPFGSLPETRQETAVMDDSDYFGAENEHSPMAPLTLPGSNYDESRSTSVIHSLPQPITPPPLSLLSIPREFDSDSILGFTNQVQRVVDESGLQPLTIRAPSANACAEFLYNFILDYAESKTRKNHHINPDRWWVKGVTMNPDQAQPLQLFHYLTTFNVDAGAGRGPRREVARVLMQRMCDKHSVCVLSRIPGDCNLRLPRHPSDEDKVQAMVLGVCAAWHVTVTKTAPYPLSPLEIFVTLAGSQYLLNEELISICASDVHKEFFSIWDRGVSRETPILMTSELGQLLIDRLNDYPEECKRPRTEEEHQNLGSSLLERMVNGNPDSQFGDEPLHASFRAFRSGLFVDFFDHSLETAWPQHYITASNLVCAITPSPMSHPNEVFKKLTRDVDDEQVTSNTQKALETLFMEQLEAYLHGSPSHPVHSDFESFARQPDYKEIQMDPTYRARCLLYQMTALDVLPLAQNYQLKVLFHHITSDTPTSVPYPLKFTVCLTEVTVTIGKALEKLLQNANPSDPEDQFMFWLHEQIASDRVMAKRGIRTRLSVTEGEAVREYNSI